MTVSPDKWIPWIPIIKMRRSLDRLIFIMGIQMYTGTATYRNLSLVGLPKHKRCDPVNSRPTCLSLIPSQAMCPPLRWHGSESTMCPQQNGEPNVSFDSLCDFHEQGYSTSLRRRSDWLSTGPIRRWPSFERDCQAAACKWRRPLPDLRR